MTNLHVKYLLVGGGIASYTAASTIRRHDADGSILLIAQEISRPYHRPPLSKGFLRREQPRESLFATTPEWFEQERIELRTHRSVAHLDVARHAATLSSGETISYDRLLLATGAKPAPLTVRGGTLPNLFTVRTIDDVAQLHNAIDKAKREGRPHSRGRGRVAVIGAGRLGVELAGSLTQLGLAVDLIAAKAHPWDRFAGEVVGRSLTRYLESHGVTVHSDMHPDRLEGDGRVQRIVLNEGRSLQCDLAIAAVGSIPNKDLLRNTPIAAENAILVDEHARTNVPDVYAAGDCCAIFDPRFGKYRWVDHYEHAKITGTLAGVNMTGGNAAYDAVSSFETDVFDLKATAWGDPRFVDRRLVRGTAKSDNPDLIEIGVAADGRVCHVIAVGPVTDAADLRELVARRTQVNGTEEQLKDAAVPISGLLN